MKNEIYVKVNSKASVRRKWICLSDVAEIWCGKPEDQRKWEQLMLMKVPEGGKTRYVISAIGILNRIRQEDASVSITLLGESDVVVDCRKKPKKGNAADLIKTILVGLILFVGAAFAIMTFNNDVDVTSIFQNLYAGFTGMESDGKTILEASYSVGIFLGIMVFFNHFSKLRISDDPTPLQVQMRVYEDEVNMAIKENQNKAENEKRNN